MPRIRSHAAWASCCTVGRLVSCMLRHPTAVGWLLVIALLAMSGFSDAAAGDRPNILFLLADDQRADTIAAHGNPRIDTPHLDGLVRRGFSFRNNYCMGSTHGAVCQPSRAMLLSGRSLFRAPQDLADTVTFPQRFRQAGYECFVTGKWHNGAASLAASFEHGKAIFLGGMSDHTRVPVADLSEGELRNERTGDRFSSELFADAAMEFLRTRDRSRPFLAYVSFTAPHDPRQPPVAYRQRYYDRHLPLPGNFLPQHPFFNGWMTGRDEQLAPWPRTEVVIRDQLAEYYGMITHLDEQIGRILATLAETGELERTWIVYTADHGLALGSHGLLGKQSLYEHSMSCPLVVAGPGVPAGGQSQALTYLLDLYPTLCEVAGVPVEETGSSAGQAIEGHSLRPLWTGESTTVRDSLYTTYERSMRAVRDARWKLIRYPHIHFTQLFDLQADPLERTNLAEQPQHAGEIERLMALLARWQQQVGDQQPLSDPQPIERAIDLTNQPRTPDAWQPEWIRQKYFRERGRPGRTSSTQHATPTR